jgi:hypothetical protein
MISRRGHPLDFVTVGLLPTAFLFGIVLFGLMVQTLPTAAFQVLPPRREIGREEALDLLVADSDVVVVAKLTRVEEIQMEFPYYKRSYFSSVRQYRFEVSKWSKRARQGTPRVIVVGENPIVSRVQPVFRDVAVGDRCIQFLGSRDRAPRRPNGAWLAPASWAHIAIASLEDRDTIRTHEPLRQTESQVSRAVMAQRPWDLYKHSDVVVLGQTLDGDGIPCRPYGTDQRCARFRVEQRFRGAAISERVGDGCFEVRHGSAGLIPFDDHDRSPAGDDLLWWQIRMGWFRFLSLFA